MRNKVLLLAPVFMGLYKDIVSGLEQMGFDVIWVEDSQIKGTPYNKKHINSNTKTIDDYENEVNCFWKIMFEEISTRGTINFFLAIDGMMVSQFFFEELRRLNPGIKTILYLYDRIENNYELDVFFPFYDRVFTFDKSDSLKYRISLLPIYWVPISNNYEELYDIFGMASYKEGARYEVYSKIRRWGINEGLKVNVSLYYPYLSSPFLYRLRYTVNRLRNVRMVSPSVLREGILTNHLMKPDEFRTNIWQSKIIIDTHNDFQDGLTARFMWALGAEKKIITTNDSVKYYDFFDPKQIFVLSDNYDCIHDFIDCSFVMTEKNRRMVSQFRIDNWIRTLLER